MTTIEVIATLDLRTPRDFSSLKGNEKFKAIAEDLNSGAGVAKFGVGNAQYRIALPAELMYDGARIDAINNTITAAATIAARTGVIPSEIRLTYEK